MPGRSAVSLCLVLPLVGCAPLSPSEPVDAGATATPSVPPVPLVKDAAPASPPPGLATLPDPIVREVAKSERGNDTYVVWGERYEVLATAAGYDSVGRASWYGTKFDGRLTSSGEVYDMFELTAAHRSLPIPSYVRVTNLGNGRSSIVRVNDRGPFHPDRIIDLSYAGAVKLGFEDEGTAVVRVESVLPEATESASASRSAAPYFVRAGRFPDFSRADAVCADLSPVAPGAAYVVRVDDAYSVRIGPLATRREVDRMQALLTFQERAPIVVEN